MILYRNIKELIKHLTDKDYKLFEALARIDETLIKVSGLLNNPIFKRVEVQEIKFQSDRNLLNSGSALTQCCRLTHSVFKSIVTATPTALDFDTKIFDTDIMYDTNRVTRININTAGRYLVGGEVRWDSNSAGYRLAYIRKNGSVVIVADQIQAVTEASTVTIQNLSTLYNFVRGDYIELVVQHNMGAGLRVTPVTEHNPIFWAHREG